jgi:hypothetical protein
MHPTTIFSLADTAFAALVLPRAAAPAAAPKKTRVAVPRNARRFMLLFLSQVRPGSRFRKAGTPVSKRSKRPREPPVAEGAVVGGVKRTAGVSTFFLLRGDTVLCSVPAYDAVSLPAKSMLLEGIDRAFGVKVDRESLVPPLTKKGAHAGFLFACSLPVRAGVYTIHETQERKTLLPETSLSALHAPYRHVHAFSTKVAAMFSSCSATASGR